MMLARYGKSTGINPNVAWPTKEEIELQKEYEAVLYDGPKSVQDMIKEVHEKERLEQEQIIQVEKEIREKLAKQEQEIKAWQKRVENRNVFAERERQKRQQILDELREEFGYEINPDDQQFAEKIACIGILYDTFFVHRFGILICRLGFVVCRNGFLQDIFQFFEGCFLVGMTWINLTVDNF